jgi:hypothetical protein
MSKPRSFSCGNGVNLGLITEVERMTFDQFAARISKPKRDKLTEREFHAADKERQDAIKKRAGWYVPAKFDGDRRAAETARFRTALTFDLDDATPELLADIESGEHRLCRYAFVAHETHKSTKGNPRIRVVVWLAARVEAYAFPAVSRAAARKLDFDPATLDKASFEAERLMYWPSRPADSAYWWARGDGEPLDPAKLKLDESGVDEKNERSREPAGDLAAAVHNTRQFESIDDLRAAVMAVKNDSRFEARDAWLSFLAAIHFESDGSDEGRELAHEWSAGWTGGARSSCSPERMDGARRPSRGKSKFAPPN